MIYFIGKNQICNYAVSETIKCDENLKLQSRIISEDSKITDYVDELVNAQADTYIFDILSFADTEDTLLNGIVSIAKMTKGDIIIFAENFKGSERILVSLKGCGLTKIIKENNLADIREKFEFLIKEPKVLVTYDEKILKTREEKDKEFLDSKPALKELLSSEGTARVLKIAVVGSEHRMGTTTVAINLMKMFNVFDDSSACYIECNKTGYLKAFKDYMDCKYDSRLDKISYNGDSFFKDVRRIKDIEKEGFSKFIYDYGVLDDDSLNHIIDKDIVIVMLGNSVLEYVSSLNAIKKTYSYPNFTFVYNFVDEKDRNIVLGGDDEIRKRQFFFSYAPDETKLSNENKNMLADLIISMSENIKPVEKKSILKRLLGK